MYHVFGSVWTDGEGGMNDYVGSAGRLEDAKQIAQSITPNLEWAQIATQTANGTLRWDWVGKPVWRLREFAKGDVAANPYQYYTMNNEPVSDVTGWLEWGTALPMFTREYAGEWTWDRV